MITDDEDRKASKRFQQRCEMQIYEGLFDIAGILKKMAAGMERMSERLEMRRERLNQAFADLAEGFQATANS